MQSSKRAPTIHLKEIAGVHRDDEVLVSPKLGTRSEVGALISLLV